MMETELSLALATNRYWPFLDRQRSLGLSPTGISSVIVLLLVLNTNSLSQPQQLIYSSFLSGDKRQAYASPPRGSFCNTDLLTRSTMYSELFSLVTTYNTFFLSSISMPAGEMLSGHFLPSRRLSFSTSLLFCTAYCSTRLSLPPEAYRYFS